MRREHGNISLRTWNLYILERWHCNPMGKDSQDNWPSIWKKLNSNFTPYTKTNSTGYDLKLKYEKQTFSLKQKIQEAVFMTLGVGQDFLNKTHRVR